MAQRPRLESWLSMRTAAAGASVALHAGLLLVVAFSGGRLDGFADDPTPVVQLVMVEAVRAGSREGIEPHLLEPLVAPPSLDVFEPAPRKSEAVARLDTPTVADLQAPSEPLDDPAERDAGIAPQLLNLASLTTTHVRVEPDSAWLIPQTHTTAMLERLERVDAQDLAETGRAELAWAQDGLEYTARLVLERAQTGEDFDRIVADVSAEDQGRELSTRILLKRLPVSHFTQLIDRWDPAVQLHDDEIVGRMHVNSRFNVLSDREARPAVIGKLSTAAAGFNLQGGRRKAEVFRGGVETSAGRVALGEQAHPFDWIPGDAGAVTHEFSTDTHIEFLAEGGYRWRSRGVEMTQRRVDPDRALYLIAGRGVALHLRGVVAGRALVYSPHRLVIEGSLTYARDPRSDPGSRDYLGLVCDRDVVIAPPYVTGRGDLDVHAALLARRRFVVTALEHRRTATLRIFGSLAAGSLTASEPRYATRVEYDRRFEQWRPPGFPSTNRFVVEDWDRRWTEASQAVARDET